MARRTPWRIPGPVLRQGQAEVEQGMVVARDVPHEDPHLAVIDFAAVAAPLPLHPDRMRAPLGETTGIKGDDTIGCAQPIDHLSNQHPDQRLVIPGGSADELLDHKALDIDQCRNVLSILAW
jgi:hypothetical protein